MKLALGIFVLLTAFALSVVAAWFSIIGMVALFSASAVGVIAMMVCLEFGKLVASGVLKMNWSNPNFNKVIKTYLFISVGVLMMITSIGIYGYLSAGHLEQKAPLAGLTVKAEQLEVQVAQRDAENERLEQRLNQIDKNVAVFLENDLASRGLSASDRLADERAEIQEKLEANNAEINSLTEQLIPLKMESNQVEAKLGPVKYVAALFGWTDTEAAVRLVILILMVAFDPLAVVLMLSGLIILREWYMERKPTIVPITQDNSVETEAPVEEIVVPSSGCVFHDIGAACPNEFCEVCSEKAKLVLSDVEPEYSIETVEAEEEYVDPIIASQADTISRLEEALKERESALAQQEAMLAEKAALAEAAEQEKIAIALEKEKVEGELGGLVEQAEQFHGQLNRWKDIAGGEYQRAREDFEKSHLAEIEAVAEAKELSRDELLKLLEQNPSIVNEIAGDVEHELSDRQKLLDLLEKDPSLINDMAEIIAAQITSPKDSWLD